MDSKGGDLIYPPITSGYITAADVPKIVLPPPYRTPVVTALVEAAAEVNVTSTDGATPLLVAATAGHAACVEQLLQVMLPTPYM